MRESIRRDADHDAPSTPSAAPARHEVEGPLPAPTALRTGSVLGGADPFLSLQRQVGNQAVGHLVSRLAGTARPTAPTVQREDPATPGPAPAAAPAGLVVEDTVTDLRPEQLRRRDFLAQARAAAEQGVAEGAGPLAGKGAAELQAGLTRHSGEPAAQLEASVRREVDGAADAASAGALIAAVRSSSSVEARARIASGLSDEVATSARDAVDNAAKLAGAAGNAISSLLFKPRGEAPTATGAADVGEARARLGAGESPPPALRSEVEQITGSDLSHVRLHRTAAGSEMADDLGARAFTVGGDVVVASGEPAPGSLVGDALVAHELAHAAQQSGAAEPAAKSDTAAADAGEHAADDVAAETVVGLRTGLRGALADLGAEAGRRIKTGLRLQRCGRSKVDPSKEQLNKTVLEKMQAANSSTSAKGIHYSFEYERNHAADWERLGRPTAGYADPAFWTREGFMTWVRKPKVSATAAMDAFFAGPTIADCASVAIASQVAALRNALGDDRFNVVFGDESHGPAVLGGKQTQLRISQSMDTSAVADLIGPTASSTDAGPPGQRNVKPGELHYFLNHPSYPIRHPTGYWQGENALYVGVRNGKQMFSGFGATESEEDMNLELVKEYNRAPTDEDLTKRRELYAKYGDDVATWPPNVRKFHGAAPEQIDLPQLLAAGGGFQATAGQELDPTRVKALAAKVDER